MTQLEHTGEGRVKVSGAMSFATVPKLWEESDALFEAEMGTLEVDLQDVERTDSAGLALLVAWMGRARDAEKFLRYAGAPEQVCTLAEANDICALLSLRC